MWFKEFLLTQFVPVLFSVIPTLMGAPYDVNPSVSSEILIAVICVCFLGGLIAVPKLAIQYIREIVRYIVTNRRNKK